MNRSGFSRYLQALLAALVTACGYGGSDNAQHVQIMPMRSSGLKCRQRLD